MILRIWMWTYLITIIPETRHAVKIRYLPFYFSNFTCISCESCLNSINSLWPMNPCTCLYIVHICKCVETLCLGGANSVSGQKPLISPFDRYCRSSSNVCFVKVISMRRDHNTRHRFLADLSILIIVTLSFGFSEAILPHYDMNKWVSDFCLPPNEPFFSHIMARFCMLFCLTRPGLLPTITNTPPMRFYNMYNATVCLLYLRISLLKTIRHIFDNKQHWMYSTIYDKYWFRI